VLVNNMLDQVHEFKLLGNVMSPDGEGNLENKGKHLCMKVE
jgi:hypothetical protein